LINDLFRLTLFLHEALFDSLLLELFLNNDITVLVEALSQRNSDTNQVLTSQFLCRTVFGDVPMHRSFQSKATHHAKLSIHDNTGCANFGLFHSELTAVVSKGF